jgi:hypothetical protein
MCQAQCSIVLLAFIDKQFVADIAIDHWWGAEDNAWQRRWQKQR